MYTSSQNISTFCMEMQKKLKKSKQLVAKFGDINIVVVRAEKYFNILVKYNDIHNASVVPTDTTNPYLLYRTLYKRLNDMIPYVQVPTEMAVYREPIELV